MSAELTFATLGPRLVEAVPELRGRYEVLLQDWHDETPGPHVIFGDVLNPLLLDWLGTAEASAADGAILRRVFAFLELLARHPDPLVQEVVSVTVGERLGNDPSVLARARPYMGERTRRRSDAIEEFWSTTESAQAQTQPETVGGASRRHA